jgi:dCTP deaminase
MTFWSGERLIERVKAEGLISPQEDDNFDCNSYQLSIGDEVYVTPSADISAPKNKTKQRLTPDNPSFTIPPGQFAFLLTMETVKIPNDAMAFISVRAKVKFRGLVNVSGFHVDPGFEGRLIFSVFNAGPAPIHFERGQACFLIWFADINSATGGAPSKHTKSSVKQDSISPDLINPIAGEVQSFEGLSSKIKETDKKLTERLTALEREQAVVRWAVTLLVGAIAATSLKSCAENALSGNMPPISSTADSAAGSRGRAQPVPSLPSVRRDSGAE